MPPTPRPIRKDEEETGYPKGWAYVTNPGQAYEYLRGLWNSPLDAVRQRPFFVKEAPAVDKEALDRLATQAVKVPSRYIEPALDVVYGILPEEVKKTIERFPPYIVVMPKEFFEVLGKTKPGTSFGDSAFYSNTDGTFLGIWKDFKSNVVFLRQDKYEEGKRNPSLMAGLLGHEILHYAEAISNPREHNDNHGLHEGITEYLAKKYTCNRGYNAVREEGVYILETQMAQVFARLAGEEELKHAYFTGDFSKIKAAVNRAGGFGTWEKLTDPIAKTGNDYDQEKYDRVFAILKRVVENAGIDKSELEAELRNMGKIR